MTQETLLSARQLMDALARLGVGSWKPDAARQWVREDPACPSEAPMMQGQPRQYRVRDVLAWLRQRATKERAKGWSSGRGADLVARVDHALAVLDGGAAPAPAPAAAEAPAAPVQSTQAAAPTPLPAPSAPPPQSGDDQPHYMTEDWQHLTDVEALLAVLENRDPRNWLAAENALLARQKRLEAARRLVPVDDIDRAIMSTVTMVRSALTVMKAQLDVDLEDCESRAERRQIIADRIDATLNRLARGGVDVEQSEDAGANQEAAHG